MYYIKVSTNGKLSPPHCKGRSMMKLYFSPGACSLSPHIVANEAGIPLELVKVDVQTQDHRPRRRFLGRQSQGLRACARARRRPVLTEGPAIVQYLADRAPAAGLAPANGSFERVRLQEALNYLTSEIHKSYSPLFNPARPAGGPRGTARLPRRGAMRSSRSSSRAARTWSATASQWRTRTCSR